MKSAKYILAISAMMLGGSLAVRACYYGGPKNPALVKLFRCCSFRLENQWNEGSRFQEHEEDENCLLWQKITSASIPVDEIRTVLYESSLEDLKALPKGRLAENRFAEWLSDPRHREDMDYVLVAKEIEELRRYMNGPWYYPYEGDKEHAQLDELKAKCDRYKGNRHQARYALQKMRIDFAAKNYQQSIDLWEESVSKMPRDILTDMMASYAGGAYARKGMRDKAIELYTRGRDIGSLISIKAWKEDERKSQYKDKRVREMEYIFERFPDSPLLAIKLQHLVRECERDHIVHETWENQTPETFDYELGYDCDVEPVLERKFYDELKRFIGKVASSPKTTQKGMWNYALAYLHYLDGDKGTARRFLTKAQKYDSKPVVAQSMRVFRILLDAEGANGGAAYRGRLLKDLQWLDRMLPADSLLAEQIGTRDLNLILTWHLNYWKDALYRVVLAEIVPRIEKSGDKVLALQLANYAANRTEQNIPQPAYERVCRGRRFMQSNGNQPDTWDDEEDESEFDYGSKFFDMFYGMTAADAAKYAESLDRPRSELEKFLIERGLTDRDYTNDVVGTLYLREMNYDAAARWLSRVSEGYQQLTNVAKCGYFRLDPFQNQADKKQFIDDSADYKLKFAQEMVRLERMMKSDAEPNRIGKAKIRFATGLRNSFGRCWYLTCYGLHTRYVMSEDSFESYSSDERECFADNKYAQAAYKRVDRLVKEAFRDFTDKELAARIQFEMKNFATVVRDYPNTATAAYVRGHCDRLHDYALQTK